MKKASDPSASSSLDDCRAFCCKNKATCATYIFDVNPPVGGIHKPMGCYTSAGKCNVMSTPSAGTAWSGASGFAPPVKPIYNNHTVSSTDLPAGCSVKTAKASANTLDVYWNTNNGSKQQCGALPAGTPIVLTGAAVTLESNGGTFGLTLALNESNPNAKTAAEKTGVATLTLAGPAGVWYGIGLGAQAMKDSPNAIIVLGNGTVFEQKLVNQGAGSRLPTSVTVVSNTVVGGVRTVVLTRGVAGRTADHYSFNPAQGTLNFINAVGKSGVFAYHKAKTASQMHLQVGGAPTCICDTGAKGYIHTDMNPNKRQFSKNCLKQPESDLLALHNPSCYLQDYRGGLKCCTSGNILLDKDQNPWEDNKLVYYMKWRFWFQDYVPAAPKATPPRPYASHQVYIYRWHE